MQKVPLTKRIQRNARKGLPDAKFCRDEVLAGRPVALTFSTAADADMFCANARQLGASGKRETRFQ
jgi:hypothetical protein